MAAVAAVAVAVATVEGAAARVPTTMAATPLPTSPTAANSAAGRGGCGARPASRPPPPHPACASQHTADVGGAQRLLPAVRARGPAIHQPLAPPSSSSPLELIIFTAQTPFVLFTSQTSPSKLPSSSSPQKLPSSSSPSKVYTSFTSSPVSPRTARKSFRPLTELCARALGLELLAETAKSTLVEEAHSDGCYL